MNGLVGSSIQRVEDARILSGRGRFVDDLKLPHMVCAAFVRSPVAHARIARVDADRARALPGVVAVFTGAEIAELTEPMRAEGAAVNFAGAPYRALAVDKVRFVGDPIALVLAETRALAEDACEFVDVELSPLDPVASVTAALAPDAPLVFEELESNIVGEVVWEHGDLEGAFAAADRVISRTLVQPRMGNNPIECRAIVASYEAWSGELTLYAQSQSPHLHRSIIAALVRHPLERMRVLVGDVGGSFGLKMTVAREWVAVAAASKALGRPVKWTEDRNEHLAAAGHAREETAELEAAVLTDGTLLGLRVRLVMDHGAYPALPMPGLLYANAMRILIPGPYRLRGLRFHALGVGTNKSSYVAFRGPWAVETWLREVLVDAVARELGLDPVDVRRTNTIRLDEQPTRMVTGPTHDGMAAEVSLERAVDRIGYVEFRAEQERARAQGRHLGVGFSTFIEAAPGPPDFRTEVGFGWVPERMEVRIEPDGHVTAVTAQSPHGQGHETTVAQVVADTLGVPFEHVRVVTGDTRVTPFSVVGTGGSRAATLASGAALNAAGKVRQKVLDAAAHLLEANPDDLDLVNGVISVRGSPEVALPLSQVARTAYFAPGLMPPGTPLGLQAVGDFAPVASGWALATHACVVEVDVETGAIAILRYVVVEDCGDLINPAIVEGQVRGGTVQGISAALLEHARYDDDGAFVTDNLLWDYSLPSVMDLPAIEIEHLHLPPIGEVNFRGVGEGGAVGAPAAVTNAIADAISPFGVEVTELPITPSRLLSLIARGRAR